MTEQYIQKKIIDLLKKYFYVVKVIQANRAGVPDIICCIEGKMVGFEVKRRGGVVSVLQEHHINLIQKAGGFAAVVYSVDDVKEKIEEWFGLFI